MTSNHIRLSIIGAGYWGPNLIRNFNKIEGCQVIWICDQKIGRRQYAKEQFPGIPVTDDLSKVLSDQSVDAVIVATPVSTHCEIALMALQAGKHVWIEKPLSDSIVAAKEIVKEAKKRNLILATDHLFIYNPAIAKMKEIISQGGIGELCYAESGRINMGPPASEVDVLWDLATHDLAISYYLWDCHPVEVIAFGYRFQHSKLIDVAFVHLLFEDGSTAVHHVSWVCPGKTRRYFVTGKKGSLMFDDTQVKKKLHLVNLGMDSRLGAKDEEVKELFYRPGKVSFLNIENVEPLRVACEDFLYCIQNGKKPRADGEAGLAVVQMLEAAKRSIAENSKPIKMSDLL